MKFRSFNELRTWIEDELHHRARQYETEFVLDGDVDPDDAQALAAFFRDRIPLERDRMVGEIVAMMRREAE